MPTRRGLDTAIKQTTKLPRVTPNDLFNINQIHAASLNGLAGQFNNQDQLQEQRKPSVNQFQVPQQQPQAPMIIQGANEPTIVSTALPPRMFKPASQPTPMSTTSTTTTSSTAGAMPQQQFGLGGLQQQQQQQNSRQQPSSPTSASTKFAMVNSPSTGSSMQTSSTSGQPAPAGSSVTYDSSPLATTNTISVHQQQPAATVTTAASIASQTLATQSAHANQHPHVLGSTFNGQQPSSIRTHHHQSPLGHHNSLASAKYSLDGIIAVAIFGGFIFLGAIITIIVIIIRR